MGDDVVAGRSVAETISKASAPIGKRRLSTAERRRLARSQGVTALGASESDPAHIRAAALAPASAAGDLAPLLRRRQPRPCPRR